MPDPERLVHAYHQSASTLNLLRAFTKGGFADLAGVHRGTRSSWRRSREGRRYERWPTRSTGPCGSWRPAASTPRASPNLHEVDFFTSHEALILGYEEALTRQDSLTGELVRLLGPHALDRRADPPARRRPRRVPPGRRQPDRLQDRAHRHGRRGAGAVRARSTPTGSPGRLTLITRMGAGTVADRLPPLLRGGARRRPSGGLGLRPDARQHVHAADRPQDPALRRRAGRDRRVLRRPRGRGHVAGRRPHRADRRRRDRMPGRRRGDPRARRPRRPLRDHVRPPAQRPPVASTWRSGSPSCSTAAERQLFAHRGNVDSTTRVSIY